ncbi:MAG: hypothetical protein C4527_05240 [Candidatus Omnitrophota bacterium]|nr:MAG: hypothetical protein C4527_05240 [Candidatus Omnitrophota bacterium]
MKIITKLLIIIGITLLNPPVYGNSDPLICTSVLDHGAVADGKTDCSEAFQKALDFAAEKGGGIVAAPAGQYLFKGNLLFPPGVTLRGVWEAMHHADIGRGTQLFVVGGKGEEEGTPFITLQQSSCLRGVTIFYPEQDVNDIRPYPWTIRGRGMFGSVIDVMLVNPYRGIDFGTESNELHCIRNVFGCPLREGIYINKTTDIGRVENVHFNPHSWARANYPNKPVEGKWDAFLDYLRENLIGFRIGKTDWEYMVNCFVIFPKIGFHFVHTDAGDPNVVLTQCGSDIGPIAVQVDASQSHAGLAFSNCQMMAQVIVNKSNRGPVKFSNCGFWGIPTTDHHAQIDGSGTVIFTSCHFQGWGRVHADAPAILAHGGKLIVNGCDFLDNGNHHIKLENDVKSAAIFGNHFTGGAKIENLSAGKVEIGLNIE